MTKQKKGFTLIELLIVVGILAILAGIVIIAVNPGRQMAQARNIQRRSDILAVLNAIHQFFIDTGNFPSDIATTARTIGTGATDALCNIGCTAGDLGSITNGCVNLNTDLVANYLTAIPRDPSFGNADSTKYAVRREADNRITVGACNVELISNLSIRR